ncbi:N-acetyltransferase [Undibacterium sp. KW1]|uniref:GNAT family N-acetyltransferase n=1 Tax=Undibacterium sp. KW1 TaxID=2058624 RepID=UPI001331D61F|nr:GNAT family N-acetyltransferase [Undibacterium sp. KW1]BBB58804.1 N-acetyltransferase [Undibacterium sp. KW1]
MHEFHIGAADPALPEAVVLLDELSERLAAITGSSGRSSFDPEDVRVPGALFVLARNEDGKAVGCGAFRPMGEGAAEVKRMYAQVSGVGLAVLAHLEAAAKEFGYLRLCLETRLINQRAVTFYEKHGYARIPNFGKYAGRTEAVCFEKILK